MKKANKQPSSRGVSPETALPALVRQGALEAIGALAVKESYDLGLPVTVLDDGVVYRVYPDGTRKVVKRLAA